MKCYHMLVLCSRPDHQLIELADMCLGELHMPAIKFVNEASLIAYSRGLPTALVIMLGEDTCTVCPVWDYTVQQESTRLLKLGGADIDK